jgi:putative phosphoribosyl transferase
MSAAASQPETERDLQIKVDTRAIAGTLVIPETARGIVLFAHGSGSSRNSPRNKFVASQLWQNGLATLLIDLLTQHEETLDVFSGEYRFNIELLADRLLAATDWLSVNPETKHLPTGYFGASTGAAAALVAAASRPSIAAVVSRGGRPDLAGKALGSVRAATLLIVGAMDHIVLKLNEQALQELHSASAKRLAIVGGATHLFEESGALEEVARLATDWFVQYLS